MDLVDTHCHIQSIGASSGERHTKELWGKADLRVENVIDEAVDHGVKHLICVGCDYEDSRLAIEFVKDKHNCYASIGIHPHEAKDYASRQDKIEAFKSLVHEPKVVAVGECGLDYYYNHSPKDAQIDILRMQIELAVRSKLPLVFHVRNAFDDFWPILDVYKGVKGVLHSFTDSKDNLEAALSRGLMIGVNGIATFTKDEKQKEVYRQIPLESLVLETDAPFLTPAPYRGTINEPKRVGVIADFLAELRGEDRGMLASTTTSNALNLFGI